MKLSQDANMTNVYLLRKNVFPDVSIKKWHPKIQYYWEGVSENLLDIYTPIISESPSRVGFSRPWKCTVRVDFCESAV